jgi:hypothetical protein
MVLDFEPKISQIYDLCGNKEKAEYYARYAIRTMEDLIKNPKLLNMMELYIEYETMGRNVQGPYY